MRRERGWQEKIAARTARRLQANLRRAAEEEGKTSMSRQPCGDGCNGCDECTDVDGPTPEEWAWLDANARGASGKLRERIDDLEKGLNEWRELALSQAGDAGIVARMVKAETEVALLNAAMRDDLRTRRMVDDFVKRDAYRYRKLLMQERHWLGVFRCNPDGTPSDSISADELSALLDAMAPGC